jgi:predicted PurR-regulated permease PerM
MSRNEEQLRWLVWLILTGLMLYLCWKMLEPFVDILLSAIVLVTVFMPLHQYIFKKTGKPGLSALATIGIILLIVIVPLTAIALGTISGATTLAGNMPGYLSSLQTKMIEGSFHNYFLKIKAWINLDSLLDPNAIRQLLSNLAEFIMKNTVDILGGTIGLVFGSVLVIFTMYYLFRDHQKLAELLPDLLPMERRHSQALLQRIREVLNASVSGVMVIAAIQGTLGGIMFWILGIPSALVWGVIMVFLSLIPILGAFVIWLPASIILLFTGHWIKCLVLFLWGTLVISMIDNVLRPKLVGQKVQMHELLIFFSVMGGLKIFGMLGILLGPVVISIAWGFIEVARSAKQEEVPAQTQKSS